MSRDNVCCAWKWPSRTLANAKLCWKRWLNLWRSASSPEHGLTCRMFPSALEPRPRRSLFSVLPELKLELSVCLVFLLVSYNFYHFFTGCLRTPPSSPSSLFSTTFLGTRSFSWRGGSDLESFWLLSVATGSVPELVGPSGAVAGGDAGAGPLVLLGMEDSPSTVVHTASCPLHSQ